MSAASGIEISKELSDTFASAVEGSTIRFIKVAIENESLVPTGTYDAQGTSLEDDIGSLQTILENDEPAYILARIGGPKELGWLAISYVPETSSVRGKMLYASTRSALTKSLGSANFSDSLFATSKADLTPEAYAAHKAHHAAPQPLSAREQEIADARAAERAYNATYEGSSARRNHVGQTVGAKWSDEAEQAVRDLGTGNDSAIVLLAIDSSETLVLSSASACNVEQLSGCLPTSEPAFAFFAWSHNHGSRKRDIIFIYSCPTTTPVKARMVYSCQARALYHVAQSLLPPSSLLQRKIETSDPSELTEAYLVYELGLHGNGSDGGTSETNSTRVVVQERGFARPKGPGRRR